MEGMGEEVHKVVHCVNSNGPRRRHFALFADSVECFISVHSGTCGPPGLLVRKPERRANQSLRIDQNRTIVCLGPQSELTEKLWKLIQKRWRF